MQCVPYRTVITRDLVYFRLCRCLSTQRPNIPYYPKLSALKLQVVQQHFTRPLLRPLDVSQKCITKLSIFQILVLHSRQPRIRYTVAVPSKAQLVTYHRQHLLIPFNDLWVGAKILQHAVARIQTARCYY